MMLDELLDISSSDGIQTILDFMEKHKGSDLYITADSSPVLKINGELHRLEEYPLNINQVTNLLKEMISEEYWDHFIKNKELNIAFSPKENTRYRISAFFQREKPGAVIRRIEMKIPSFSELQLPPVLKELVLAKNGLILVVGSTGAGKSTSLAAMIGYRNQQIPGHTITIEDPIEFIHEHHQSIMTQREVGLDTVSFEIALKNALRQAPDVLLIGEIRNQEILEYALNFADTGHLVMATLHANNADLALDRMINMMPQDSKHRLLFDLSNNLRCILAQQLIPDINGEGRHPAFEILVKTPVIGEYIKNNELHKIKEIMTRGLDTGMQSFDQSLYQLYIDKRISYSDALHFADSKNDLRLMIKLNDQNYSEHNDLEHVTLDYD